jgi:hypothetical protein
MSVLSLRLCQRPCLNAATKKARTLQVVVPESWMGKTRDTCAPTLAHIYIYYNSKELNAVCIFIETVTSNYPRRSIVYECFNGRVNRGNPC